MALISINTDGIAKVAEIIAHCTGLNAYGIKKNAEAKYYADELEIKSANNVALLKEQGNDSLANYIAVREQRKASNVASIVQKTTECFTPDEQVSEERPSQDWLNRFFEYAESISEDEMQNLWASLLAGEIKQPKTFSKRTLDVIRNLSSEDAQLIKKYAGCLIETDLPFVKQCDDLDEINSLAEIGFLNPQILSMKRTFYGPQKRVIAADDEYVVIIETKERIEFEYSVRPLTNAGIQILKLFTPKIIPDYYHKFAINLVEKYDLSISLHNIIGFNHNSYEYEEASIFKIDRDYLLQNKSENI